MSATKSVRRFIEAEPFNPNATILADLVIALESDQPFTLARLYALDLKYFEWAIEVLHDWRIDRHYASKVKLLDISQQLKNLAAQDSATQPAPTPAV